MAPAEVSSAEGQAVPFTMSNPTLSPGENSVYQTSGQMSVPITMGALGGQGASTHLSHQEPQRPAGKQENEPIAYITIAYITT